MVRMAGFDPAASCSPSTRSSRLSYTPMVSVAGIEPATPWFQARCASAALHADDAVPRRGLEPGIAGSQPAVMPFHHTGMREPRDGVEPSWLRYKGSAGAGRRGMVRARGVDPRWQASKAHLLAGGARSFYIESAPRESNPPDAVWKTAAFAARPDARWYPRRDSNPHPDG